MGQDFLGALALMLVFEGLMPFASPPAYRRAVQSLATLGDGALRAVGLAAMLAGLIMLYATR
ncbi:MAG: DUF2065 domain-containing protein [Gammaproteobacteria bacterium]